jgi:hypothetical protein
MDIFSSHVGIFPQFKKRRILDSGEYVHDWTIGTILCRLFASLIVIPGFIIPPGASTLLKTHIFRQ